jgi:hypothetical protein
MRDELSRLSRDVHRLQAAADARDDEGGKMLQAYIDALFALGAEMETEGRIEEWSTWLIDDALPTEIEARLLAEADVAATKEVARGGGRKARDWR